MSKFQQYPGATFSEIDVENYLEELAKKGWQVFKHRNEYVVVIDDERKITTWFNSRDKEWGVDASNMEGALLPFPLTSAITFQQFKTLFAKAAKYLNEDLDIGPKSIRLNETTPVSNKHSFVSLLVLLT